MTNSFWTTKSRSHGEKRKQELRASVSRWLRVRPFSRAPMCLRWSKSQNGLHWIPEADDEVSMYLYFRRQWLQCLGAADRHRTSARRCPDKVSPNSRSLAEPCCPPPKQTFARPWDRAAETECRRLAKAYPFCCWSSATILAGVIGRMFIRMPIAW